MGYFIGVPLLLQHGCQPSLAPTRPPRKGWSRARQSVLRGAEPGGHLQAVREYEEQYLAVWREQREAAMAAHQAPTVPGMLKEAVAILEAPASMPACVAACMLHAAL